MRIFLFFLTFVSCSIWAQEPELIVQAGHTNLINSLTISKDSKWLATGSIDQSIKIWDIESGKLLKNIQNEDAVYSLAFYPDKNFLLSGCYGINTESMKLWKIDENIYVPYDLDGGILNINVSPSNKYLLVSNSNGYLYLWDLELGKAIRNYVAPVQLSLGPTAILEEANIIAAGTSEMIGENKVFIWDLLSDTLLATYNFTSGINKIHLIDKNIMMVEVNTYFDQNIIYKMNINTGIKLDSFNLSNSSIYKNQDNYILGQDKLNNIVVIDIATGKLVKNIPTKEKYIDETIVSPDKQYLILTGSDIEIIDLETLQSLHYIIGDRWIDGLSFTAKANKLAFSGNSGQIINWDLETGNVEIWKGHTGNVIDLNYDKDGRYFASAAYDSTVIVRNGDGKILYSIPFNDNNFNHLSMTTDAYWLSVSLGDSIYTIKLDNGVVDPPISLWGQEADNVTYSPNGRDFAAILGNVLIVYDMIQDSFKVQFDGQGGLEDLSFTSDGELIAIGGYTDSLFVINVSTNEIVFTTSIEGNYVGSLAFDPTSLVLAVGYSNGQISLFDIEKKQLISSIKQHSNIVNKLSYRSDGKVLASASWDGKLILWDTDDLQKMAELYAFDDGTWAVIDDYGRYDASNAGNIDHLHFVVSNQTIALDQLKERYYEPGLLQKLLGYNEEKVRDVQKLDNVALYPSFELHLEGDQLEIVLEERGGGIGRMPLFINNKEIESDISNQLKIGQTEGTYFAQINLLDYEKYLKLGELNEVGISANNKENYLSSPKRIVNYKKKMTSGFLSVVVQPSLYAIIIGSSDYRGTGLDLKFADKDAERFHSALSQTGKALFGEQNLHLSLLTTTAGNESPSKENIQKVFESIASHAAPNDVLVVYLSGHGVNFSSENETQFYYLTKDVESGNLADSEIRKSYAISTAELTQWINNIPVDKQVLILDACASGKAIEDIMVKTKSVTSSQIRAFERMKDRTGMFVLAGSTSDQVSFEASQFGQSLLTYSLLAGIKGQSLRENEFVDVLLLFEHSVEQVPELAAYIGGIQKPIIAIPYGGKSFDIGKVDETVAIDLPGIKPVFIRSNFQDEVEFADILGLSAAIDNQLRTYSTKGNSSEIIFVDVSKYPEAYSIKGRYEIVDGLVKIKGKVYKDSLLIGPFELEGLQNDIDKLIDSILEKAYQLMGE